MRGTTRPIQAHDARRGQRLGVGLADRRSLKRLVLDLEPRIELSPDVMDAARVPLERMLEMAGRTVGQGDVGTPIIDEPERIDPAISGD